MEFKLGDLVETYGFTGDKAEFNGYTGVLVYLPRNATENFRIQLTQPHPYRNRPIGFVAYFKQGAIRKINRADDLIFS